MKALKNNKHGSVSRPVKLLTAVTAVVIAIAIVITLLLASLPTGTLEFDMTENSLYGVTDVTRSMLNRLQDDIEITIISETSSIDEHFTKFIGKYAALSPHLTLNWVDPVLYPSAAEEYDCDHNTVLVTNLTNGKSSSFSLAGFEGQDTAALLYDYTSYYMYGNLTLSSLDAEGLLAGAISAVTSENAHKLYYLAGHGETYLPNAVSSLVKKANYSEDYIDLLAMGGAPDDCELIVCNTPTSDISADELDILQRWMAKGGKLFLVIDDNTLTNFRSLLLTYGIQMGEGRLADMQNYYASYLDKFGYYCFYPEFNEDSALCEGVSSNAMVVGAIPLTSVTPERRSSSTESFMTSSTYGLDFHGQEESEMENAVYSCGMVATEDVDDGITSRLTVISSAYFDSDSLLTNFPSLSNTTIMMNCINANFDNVSSVTIPARSVASAHNSFTSTAFYSIFFIAVIPAAFLIYGLAFWLKRRKK